ncbi:FAD/NAD(P)-binding domain-containing protein [Dendrothele bispora CBS 962.96]|uniref:FAD/NAD(P)-binding domain-containing protein n=1 Tax=Dendrothele bispora (strain CBS 962.96) TaxID=1314807 RepID=A0A4S8MGA6_DENBC|nr:FAD/NAD(P)-binding domain-containing protein [Dendrothele bispora CBS 962.96]
MKPSTKKRVLVIGAGAAGMACADTLIQHPDRFDVTLVEAQDYCGGQMFSIPIDKERHGAGWLNQGVQGGSYIYKHTFHMFGKLGYKAYPVDLQVSFGKDDTFWTNVFPTTLISKHSKEIKRFSWVIKFMRWFEAIFAMVPIKISLKLFWFSDEFINCMIYPSLALFLGTGNATPNLPTIMMERLYTSPTYGMWYPPDPSSLTSNLPPMVVFPEAMKVYSQWKEDLEKKGVQVRLETEVTRVVERKKKGGVKVAIRKAQRKMNGSELHGETELQSNDQPRNQGQPRDEEQETIEEYDEIVFCVLADTAKRILGDQARWIEKKVLGATKWSDDVTVTHTDLEYMKKWYDIEYREDLAVKELPGGKDQSARVEKARKEGGFKPMYYIKQTPSDPRKLEMSFDCSAFQHQFSSDLPLERRVFQTIFLNKKDEEGWSMEEIRKDKIIATNWWHQLCHSYTHYLFVVPFLFLLQNPGRKSHTTYAGSWTIVNAHEAAVISGIAAAYALGARYPKELEEDEDEKEGGFARLCFKLYLLLIHWVWYKRGKTRA